MSYVGVLYYVGGTADTIEVGMAVMEWDVFSADILDALPGGNVVQAIATIIDTLQNGISLPGYDFTQVAPSFPSLLPSGTSLPYYQLFLTGDGSFLTLFDDYKLQYVSGKVQWRAGETPGLTTSTVSICKIAFAIYQKQSIQTPMFAPVTSGYYKRFATEGGAFFLPKNPTPYTGEVIAARMVQYNEVPMQALSMSEANLSYLSVWFGGGEVPEHHILSGQRDVDVISVETPYGIDIVLVSEGVDCATVLTVNRPSPLPGGFVLSILSTEELYLIKAGLSGLLDSPQGKPPYYIPTGGGEPEGSFEGGLPGIPVAPLAAIAVLVCIWPGIRR